MSKTSIMALCVAISLAAGVLVWFAANHNDTLRGIKLAIRLPPHRQALVAQCPRRCATVFEGPEPEKEKASDEVSVVPI
jgi:hypothetical protein